MPKIFTPKGKVKSQSYSFKREIIFVGRSTESDLQIKDGAVSRKHFKIYRLGKKIYVEDLVTKNGTFINGERMAPWKGFEVSEEDTISIANTEFQLSAEDDILHIKAFGVKDATARFPEADPKKKKKPFKERRFLSRKNLELIWEVTELLRQSMGIEEILGKISGLILDSLPRIDTVVIPLYDQQEEEIKETVSRSRQEKDKEEVRYSRSVVNRVLKEGKAVRMSNTEYEPPEDLSDSIIELKIRSILCVPLISNEETFGAIYVDSRGAYGFRKDDLLLLNSLSGPVAVAVEKTVLASRLQGTAARSD